MRLPLPQFATEERHPDWVAEVVETATTGFLAQCLDPEELDFPVMPPFGSWVKATDEESGNLIFAVVTHATTAPIDSVHRARALGLSLEELRQQQPQIFAMLRTEFHAAILGFARPLDRGMTAGNGTANLGQCYQYLPPRPPQIHQAVYRADPDEICYFSAELDFIRTLLDVRCEAPTDSLVAAVLRGVFQLRQGDREWLVAAGRKLSVLLKDDYDRLRYVLGQIHW